MRRLCTESSRSYPGRSACHAIVGSWGDSGTGSPGCMDRVIQQAITQVLTPVFDPHFSESSFGFRPSCSAHQAVKKALKDIQRGYHYAVDIDLEKFFPPRRTR
jgi:retron-type reverse transcriptase